MTQVHVTEHLNYVCDRVCLWKFESMSKISYIIHVFCQLVFPGRKVKRIPTLDSGGVGGWGCLGSYTMNLEERKTKYGHTGLISKRGKQKTCFHVWVHYCQTVCPPVPSVVTQVSERRGEEGGWRHGLGEMSYYNNNAPSKSVIQWQHFILSRQLQQSAIVQKKWKRVLITDQMVKWGNFRSWSKRRGKCRMSSSSPNWNILVDSNRNLEWVQITSAYTSLNGDDT